ncbi:MULTISPECIES: hypothetical protein [unclassified Bradyrhizobium]|uniref:hypothetical protein n=1 Tax=unclassified Bradyrhizobium TaxID=2631580 RepID=UPI001FF8DECD|nr:MULTISPECIES: hypothetical protein [unclassified Bradyrhizobium]MCK1316537.1 hypothetical protein [Bradyrhizobium sp. 23]MCK1329173.1 hypothetical protein [Bradyrhizobium sp. CW9]MCK1505276.1 hypothetical protein [Bradyrhizobium sp. 18]MCK1628806.1 hypothetical protein [Bradyrhizobium sp. 162]MCK1698868.1 hypothetical protein [Bradyrhizobium sp. 144]
MTEKFDPAPPDKNAEDLKRGIRRDKARDDELDKGLKDRFPASDPVSSTQASKATPDA